MSKRQARGLYIVSAIEIGTMAVAGFIGLMAAPWRFDVAFGCMFLATVGVTFNVTEVVWMVTQSNTKERGK